MLRPSAHHLFLAASLLGSAASKPLTKAQECIFALTDVYGNLNFDGVGYADYYGSLCGNPLKVASMYAASHVFCSERDSKAGFKLLTKYCVEYGPGSMMAESVVAVNTSEKAISDMKVIDPVEAADLTANYTTPVLLSKDLFTLGYKTEDDWDTEMRMHTDYGWAMYGFWGGILVIGMLHRLVTHFRERRVLRTSIHEEDTGAADTRGGASTGFVHSISAWVDKHLITPSAIPPFRRQPIFGCTIPTRLESMVIYAYWAISIILCSVNYRAFSGNLYWPDVPVQTWRYVSDRTGIAAYANLPLLWMFSGRNNVFMWLTGWNFSTFNLFHRHIARVATAEAIIHSVGYTAFYYKAGSWEYYKEDYKEPWFYLGVVACIVMSFLVLFSFRYFRHKWYESFLLLHIVFSVAVIVSLFYHTSIFDGDYDPYLWPLVAIWLFDRFLRVVRLIYCNLHVRFQKGKTVHSTKATVTYHEGANMLHIQVTPAAAGLNQGPGQHYFLYQPFRWTGWENHPFTLTSWGQSGSSTVEQVEGETPSENTSDNSLSFWVRPHGGWTETLRKKCSSSPNAAIPSTILVEGPYGKSEPLWAFEEVLLIAGGSGIAAIVPYIIDHVRRDADGKTKTKSITLVWADRKEEYVKHLVDGPLSDALAREDVNATIYITSDSAQSPASSSLAVSSEKAEPTSPEEGVFSKETQATLTTPRSKDLSIQHGRPNVRSIIEKAAASVNESQSKLAVFVCGPPNLADETRDATYRSMDGRSSSVQYFEEAFGW